ncbi:hypothetical protein [Maledivibacter halophilus]|uniref:Uncharacterized protein n=1 Tax=Maledivibacter halophilus TaxID=36842 RepID=A0A1T5MF12_9FIRM|nr:hypothetical protein [Maledivibacter halophilus]SKC86831.1 hypothetical protein SAMN02194393_04579 [Maledivibacter halophilus]
MEKGTLKILGIFAGAAVVVTLTAVIMTKGPDWIIDTIDWVKAELGM